MPPDNTPVDTIICGDNPHSTTQCFEVWAWGHEWRDFVTSWLSVTQWDTKTEALEYMANIEAKYPGRFYQQLRTPLASTPGELDGLPMWEVRE